MCAAANTSLEPGKGEWEQGKGEWEPGKGEWEQCKGEREPGTWEWEPGKGEWGASGLGVKGVLLGSIPDPVPVPVPMNDRGYLCLISFILLLILVLLWLFLVFSESFLLVWADVLFDVSVCEVVEYDFCGGNRDGNNDDRWVDVAVFNVSTVHPKPSSPYNNSRKMWKKFASGIKPNKYSESLQTLKNKTIFSPIWLFSDILPSLFNVILSEFLLIFFSINVVKTFRNDFFVDSNIVFRIDSWILYDLLKITTFSKFWDVITREVSFFFTEISSEIV